MFSGVMFTSVAVQPCQLQRVNVNLWFAETLTVNMSRPPRRTTVFFKKYHKVREYYTTTPPQVRFG